MTHKSVRFLDSSDGGGSAKELQMNGQRPYPETNTTEVGSTASRKAEGGPSRRPGYNVFWPKVFMFEKNLSY